MHQKDNDAEVYYLDDDYYSSSSADDDAFIGDQFQFDFVKPAPKNKDGCICKKCKEYFEYAIPNQSDNTLICWACRHNY